MSVLSKLQELHTTYSTPYNCYELAHVWDPDCLSNAIDFTTGIFLRSCGLYFPLFVANHVLAVRKYDRESLTESGISVIRSSAFIANHVLTFFTLFCGSRSLLGKFYFTVHAFPITFLISFLSLQLEKKSRRGPLALYVLNIGSECLIRLLVDRSLVPNIPHAPVLLFTATMSLLLYLIRRDGGYGRRSDAGFFALKLLLGSSATGDKRRRRITSQSMSQSETTTSGQRCSHDSSCVQYSIHGFVRPFLAAWLGSAAVASAKELVFDPQKVLQSASPVTHVVRRITHHIAKDNKSLRFGLFVGSFAGIFKCVTCFLRQRDGGHRDWHSAAAGLMAGPAMLIHPHPTIALYFFWKLIESLFLKSVKAGYVNPGHKQTVVNVVYALSVSQIAYCVLLQPKYMRPSYMRLADIVTGHKFHLLNRCFCPFLVPDAVHGYEDYFPDLDPRFCSQEFMATVIPWILESKEYCRRGAIAGAAS